MGLIDSLVPKKLSVLGIGILKVSIFINREIVWDVFIYGKIL